ncbi:hypothetical protein AXF42_Ash005552 [Apostasia shenzhenica]|uniref:Uncharacterized protein n=1 Tax=Apostasia shenzhenica TaxID=1088818 RepID=A0A2I0B775_9ASPA|nr:hypothetical protein AXF42_Ash005552 [Apostasia shenzhenica]
MQKHLKNIVCSKKGFRHYDAMNFICAKGIENGKYSVGPGVNFRGTNVEVLSDDSDQETVGNSVRSIGQPTTKEGNNSIDHNNSSGSRKRSREQVKSSFSVGVGKLHIKDRFITAYERRTSIIEKKEAKQGEAANIGLKECFERIRSIPNINSNEKAAVSQYIIDNKSARMLLVTMDDETLQHWVEYVVDQDPLDAHESGDLIVLNDLKVEAELSTNLVDDNGGGDECEVDVNGIVLGEELFVLDVVVVISKPVLLSTMMGGSRQRGQQHCRNGLERQSLQCLRFNRESSPNRLGASTSKSESQDAISSINRRWLAITKYGGMARPAHVKLVAWPLVPPHRHRVARGRLRGMVDARVADCSRPCFSLDYLVLHAQRAARLRMQSYDHVAQLPVCALETSIANVALLKLTINHIIHYQKNYCKSIRKTSF